MLLVALLATPAAEAQVPTVSLEYLSHYFVAGGARFEGTCIGGLSALYYDPERDRYFALSDSGKDARFYTLEIEIGVDDEGTTRIFEVHFDAVVRLKTREGLPYPEGRIDPEGFALLDAGAAFLASEGAADEGVPPFIDLVDPATGAWLGTAAVPLAYHPRRGESAGVRRNQGFESLTLDPDRRNLYVATESPLAQDAGWRRTSAGKEIYARLLRYELGEVPRLAEELLYPLTVPEGDVVAHGIVELLALGGGRLLALERTYAHDRGMHLAFFEARLGERRQADRSRLAHGTPKLPVVAKQKLLDFAALDVLLENYEGVTFGPALPGGGESLLVVGDNDNTDCQPPETLTDLRPTAFLLFALWR